MRVCITGGAGFLGSNLARSFASDAWGVVIVDDFRTGRHANIADLLPIPSVTLCQGDVLDQDFLEDAMRGSNLVVHLQAYADVRTGTNRPTLAIRQNALATSNVLEAMRGAGVDTIALASSDAVYGETDVIPTPETLPFPEQTSLYGASKVFAEGLVSAYCHSLGFTGVAFRFVPLLGQGYTHGHLFDFYRKLKQGPTKLNVLGNGTQRRSYLWVGDAVAAIRTAVMTRDKFRAYNVGTDTVWSVRQSVKAVADHLDIPSERLWVTYGEGGWHDKVPVRLLDCSRLRGCFWEPELTIPEAVQRTLNWFDVHPELFT